jgi:hypothetical protein
MKPEETCFECMVVQADLIHEIALASIGGDQDADNVMRAIMNFILTVVARGFGPLCLDCDKRFGTGAVRAAGFLVVLPMFEGEHGLVSGICPDCMKGDVQEKVIRRLGPSMKIVPIGHA